MVFLQTVALGGDTMGGVGALLAVGLGIIILIFLIMIGLYVFMSLAYMSIAKRVGKTSPTGISFIPGIGPLIIAWHASGMHWWPWLLLVGMYIPFLNFAIIPIFWVFTIIWMWKMFVAVGRPGWWGLVPLLPLIGFLLAIVPSLALVGMIVAIIGLLLHLVLLGIAAWGEEKVSVPVSA